MKKILFLMLAALILDGCEKENRQPPNRMSIVSVSFRRGFASDYVLQVGNLSASQGIEVKVHAVSAEKTCDSDRYVIPSGAKRDIGVLEMGWNFTAGDRGCVSVESHPTKAYFAILPDGKYGIIYSQADYTDEELAKKDFSKALRQMK